MAWRDDGLLWHLQASNYGQRPDLQLGRDSLTACRAIGLENYGQIEISHVGNRSKMAENPSNFVPSLTLVDAMGSLCFQLLVERFSTTGFRCLYIVIFALETACRTLIGQNLFDESSLALFVWKPGSEVLGWSFNYGAHLGIFRYGSLRSFLVMPVRIQYGPHLKESHVCFELRSQVGARDVEEVRPCSSTLFLSRTSARCKNKIEFKNIWENDILRVTMYRISQRCRACTQNGTGFSASREIRNDFIKGKEARRLQDHSLPVEGIPFV